MFNDDSWENKLGIRWAEATAGRPLLPCCVKLQWCGEKPMEGVVLCFVPKNILMLQVIGFDTTKCTACCKLLLRQSVRQSHKWTRKQMDDRH